MVFAVFAMGPSQPSDYGCKTMADDEKRKQEKNIISAGLPTGQKTWNSRR
jgi:hypothetical protein